MRKIILISMLFISSISFATEKRCGWISNPTPANIWLNDADGEWLLSVQGGYQTEGLDNLIFPDSDSDKYVRTNGYYGYYCGCVTAETSDHDNQKLITKIVSSEVKSLKACLEDPKLNGQDAMVTTADIEDALIEACGDDSSTPVEVQACKQKLQDLCLDHDATPVENLACITNNDAV